MGYCYEGRKLCCDICGKPGARKYRCPWGYCPSTAVCPECRKKHADKFSKKAHRAMGCEHKHNEYQRSQIEKLELLEQGKLLLKSALGVGEGEAYKVHALFIDYGGNYHGFYIPKELYDSVTWKKDNVTVDDYTKLGKIEPAPNDF